MKYYFPLHLDGGNRGCEAIAKGTAILLQEKKENLTGLCKNIELDKRLGLDQFVTLQPSPKDDICFKIKNKLYRRFVHDEWARSVFFYNHLYKSFLNQIQRDDIMLSTGGDMMCYDDNEVIYTVDYLHRTGVKSVLWGCSIGENNLTPRKIHALKQFALIYARETLTKEMLNQHGFDNVVVFPDPAFVLKPEVCTLAECFSSSEVIGLNISNFVIGGFELDTPFAKEIIKMVEYILTKTKFHILLIPHVMWKGQDDRIVSRKLRDYFGTDRISMLDSDKLNYCQIRYVISKCKIFIGARTHAVISAYSTNTPAVAIGYSIKSKGIAKDTGMPEETIVNSKSIIKGQLLNAYLYVMQNVKQLKMLLTKNMDTYIKKTLDAHNIIDSIKTGEQIIKK